MIPQQRPFTIFVLDAGDEISFVSGENIECWGSEVVGKIEIETIKGKKYGPFGSSGSRLARRFNVKNVLFVFRIDLYN